jgi:hypothetical protein
MFYIIGVERLGRVNPVSPKILPPNSTMIRHLAFECNIDSVLFSNGLFIFRQSSKPFTTESWALLLPQLPHLRVLFINMISHAAVFDSHGRDDGNSETAVFAPLMAARGLHRFEIVVRWKYPYRTERRRCHLQNDYSQAPFRLTEIQDHVIKEVVVQGIDSVIDVKSWAETVMHDGEVEALGD